jgi:hypothetical protein
MCKFAQIYAVQSNLCWKIHNKYVFHVYLCFKISRSNTNNSKSFQNFRRRSMEQPPNAVCIQFTNVKNYRICPIRIEIIHDRHRFVQIYTWAVPLYSVLIYFIAYCQSCLGLTFSTIKLYLGGVRHLRNNSWQA